MNIDPVLPLSLEESGAKNFLFASLVKTSGVSLKRLLASALPVRQVIRQTSVRMAPAELNPFLPKSKVFVSGVSRQKGNPFQKNGTGRGFAQPTPNLPSGFFTLVVGRFISWGFLMMWSEPFLNFSFRKKSCKRNRPFLMLNCVRADGCFGQCDPPLIIPFATRLAPANAHPLCRFLVLAPKKRPGTRPEVMGRVFGKEKDETSNPRDFGNPWGLVDQHRYGVWS